MMVVREREHYCPGCGWSYDRFHHRRCPNCLRETEGDLQTGPVVEPVDDIDKLVQSRAQMFEKPVRPSWDSIWMGFAGQLARRSTCRRLSVGCVVVSEDNSIVLGMGYNGGAKGQSNDCLSSEAGNCGHIHAEINALIKTNYRDAAPKKVYTTSEPCYVCAEALVNAGIQEVIYRDPYRKHDGLALLAEAGVRVRRYPQAPAEPYP